VLGRGCVGLQRRWRQQWHLVVTTAINRQIVGNQHAFTIWFRAVTACCGIAEIILGIESESGSWKCVLWMDEICSTTLNELFG